MFRPQALQLVEFGDDLLRRLQARHASVKAGNVAKLAGIGAAAGKLQRAEEIAVEFEQLIGGNGEGVERQPLPGLEADLLRRPGAIAPQSGKQFLGRVAQFADMEKVGVGVELGTGGNRGTAERDRLAVAMGAGADVADLPALHVHAADEDGVGPGKIRFAGGSDVFVDEPDPPPLGQRRRRSPEGPAAA